MPAERPYIGVTGISNVLEGSVVARNFDENLNPESSHQGMIGFLMSDRYLNSQTGIGRRHPAMSSLNKLLESSKADRAINAIHFSSQDRNGIVRDVKKLFGETGFYDAELATGLQLNAAWPKPEQVADIRNTFPDLKIILQLGGRILDNQQTNEIVDQLAAYRDTVNYVLIDPSGGRGLPINERGVAPLYRQISYAFPNLGVAIAGGFSDKNVVQVLQQLTRILATDEFGIDAQSGLYLKDRSIKTGINSISLYKARDYIQRACGFFA